MQYRNVFSKMAATYMSWSRIRSQFGIEVESSTLSYRLTHLVDHSFLSPTFQLFLVDASLSSRRRKILFRYHVIRRGNDGYITLRTTVCP